MSVRRLVAIRAFLSAAVITASAAPLWAGILTVPGSAATIQGAIVLAGNGDTILVAPGTYVETIDLLGKQLVLEGTGGAAVTIIDANGGGTTVSVHTGEPAGTVIRGFTITGGTGQVVYIPAFGSGDPEPVTGAGGVHVGPSSHLELTDCVITGNSVSGSFQAGGGVCLTGGTLAMSGCTLSGNTAMRGAAIGLTGYPHTLTATGCTLTGNTATTSSGSALYAWNGVGTFTDCAITDNTGNGIQLVGYQTHFSQCVVRGNTGWGMTAYGDIGPDVIGLAFLGNGLGGATCSGGKYFGSSDIVRDCVFAGGDGLNVSQNNWADIINCTFDDVTITATGTTTTIKNSIGRGTTTIVGYDSLAVTYSDIVGWGAGTGNIDADPLWVNAAANDYSLQPSSPCIDAGDPGSPLDPDGTRADMGAVPFENAFDDLGGGVAGSAGPVVLAAHGTLIGGEDVILELGGTKPLQATVMVLGASQLGVPFKGGTMWPALTVVVSGLLTDGAGQLTLASTWPVAPLSGLSIWVQFWNADAGAILGFAGSNGVRGTVP